MYSYSDYCTKTMTKHAVEQARERNISMAEVVETVTQADLKTKSDTEKHSRLLYWRQHAERLLVVVVGTNPKYPRQVVSVYPATRGKQRAYARMMAQQAA